MLVVQVTNTNKPVTVYIQYGDLCDLMLMLDLRLGGGVMDAVNEGQKLVERRIANNSPG